MFSSNEISLISLAISLISIAIAFSRLWLSRQIHEESKGLTKWIRNDQRTYEETELRRDVLRRIMGYAYRLTEGSQQIDGEPFTALNEALIVFNDCPKVKELIRKFHQELGTPERFSANYLRLIEEMANSSGISIEVGDSNIIEKPFGPKKPPAFAIGSAVITSMNETTS